MHILKRERHALYSQRMPPVCGTSEKLVSTYLYLHFKNKPKITKYSTSLHNSAKQILKLGSCRRSYNTSSGKILILHLLSNLFWWCCPSIKLILMVLPNHVWTNNKLTFYLSLFRTEHKTSTIALKINSPLSLSLKALENKSLCHLSAGFHKSFQFITISISLALCLGFQ